MFTRQIAQKILKWKIEASPVNAALSSTSNKAIESVLLSTEWTIITRQEVLRFAHMKYQYFCPRMLQAERSFFRYKAASPQNRSYLDNT